MTPISEKTIDAVVARIDDMPEAEYDAWVTGFSKNQPVLVTWLYGETFESLTEDENAYLQYLALIIWKSIETELDEPIPATENEIGEWEEKNCATMENERGVFADKLDAFFKDYDEEDLLAFVEDALVEEEGKDAVVTKEGRELLFIALKTVIDSLV